MDKRPLIVIVGPTASGKTALAAELCRRIGGEVVTADSMQVYRGMDIGTAKPGNKERGGVPHHMIDMADPDESYSVYRYAREAAACIEGILGRGCIPVLSGGTGLYVDAVLYPMRFTQAGTDELFRSEMALLARSESPQALHSRLERVDPVSAARIHPNNVKRVIRALEVFQLTGAPLSEQGDERRAQWEPFACFGLSLPRETLYERIDRRVDGMMANGLPAEVERLRSAYPSWSETARQALGYKELLECVQKGHPPGEAAEMIKRRTRRYAKRQMTWFGRMRDIQWIYAEGKTEDEKIKIILKKLIEKSFIIM